MSNYSLFIPPKPLSDLHPKKWTSKQANEYKEWLLGTMVARINFLLCFLNVLDNKNHSLLSIGKKSTELFHTPEFNYEEGGIKRLNNQGYALAADLGLLVAQKLILSNEGKVYWSVLKKPKSELSYNLPVLQGFAFNYLDPVGGSIAEASAVLRGDRDASAWNNIFEFWNSKVPVVLPKNSSVRKLEKK